MEIAVNFLYSTICGEPAVYGNDRARYEPACVIVRQPQKRSNQVGNLAEFLHGRCRQDLARSRRRRAVLVKEQASVLVGYEEPRRDRVATDIAGREMHRKPLRKIRNTRFRRAVRGNFGKRSVCVHRRNIDDISARFYHIFRKYLRYQKRARNI